MKHMRLSHCKIIKWWMRRCYRHQDISRFQRAKLKTLNVGFLKNILIHFLTLGFVYCPFHLYSDFTRARHL